MINKLENNAKSFDLAHTIADYIDYMAEIGLNISVFPKFDFNGKIYSFDSIPYCNAVGVSRRAWKRCADYREEIMERLQTEDCVRSTCPSGVTALFFAVKGESGTVGYVSVEGYREPGGTALVRNTARDYALSTDLLARSYEELKSELPLPKALRPLIAPLTYMLGQYVTQAERNGGADRLTALSSADYVFERAVTYLADHYARKLSLSEVADHCRCSTSTLSHTFKKRCGCTINAFVNRIRINNAKSLLVSRGTSISHVASLVGLDPDYFTTLFTRQEGVSPSEYRALHSSD